MVTHFDMATGRPIEPANACTRTPRQQAPTAQIAPRLLTVAEAERSVPAAPSTHPAIVALPLGQLLDTP